MTSEEAAAGGIAARLADDTLRLPPTGRRIARALLENYPAAGLDTVASLASAAGVSAPSVVRFVSALGFESFRAFQDELRDELGGRDASALSQARVGRGRQGDPLDASRRAIAAGVEDTLGSAARSDFAAAVALLGAEGRRVTAVGGDYSRAAAAHLVAQLAPIRPEVRLLPGPSVLAAAELADARPGDVMVIFDFRRYQPRMAAIARRAAEAGGRVVLVTDRWRSPVAASAHVTLIARVESAGASDTLVPALALVEALSEAVERRRGEDALERLAAVDPIRRELDGLD